VHVSGLRKVFDVGRRDGTSRRVTALDGVEIEVGEGESVGVVGESGSGKSTLARCLVGLETPSSGEILIDGMRANEYGRLARSDARRLRRTIQIVFQDPYSSLNPMRTIGATLREALKVAGTRQDDTSAKVAELLEAIGLPVAYAARKPVALSGGERQRVAIARAIAVRPRILVCDEPVSSLDVSVQAQILNIFKALRSDRGMAYLFITHDLAVVRQVVERVYVMHNGLVVEQGPVDDVLDHPRHSYTAALVASIPRSEANWLASSQAPSRG
jgi:peptide/nickel transport system ATP-binding protein